MTDHRQVDAFKQALREHEAEKLAAANREPLRTLDDVRKLSVEEVIARRAEVDAVMASPAPPEDEAA